jgi:DNA repair protein RadC
MIIRLNDEQQTITAPQEVFAILNAILATEDAIDRDKEHFWVFHLDARKHIRVLELVSLGILDKGMVHPREVSTRAITIRCHSILVAHNHPSGNPEPSDEDVNVTRKLKAAGDILDIPLVDHVIIGKDTYVSMKAEGRF